MCLFVSLVDGHKLVNISVWSLQYLESVLLNGYTEHATEETYLIQKLLDDIHEVYIVLSEYAFHVSILQTLLIIISIQSFFLLLFQFRNESALQGHFIR